MAALGRESSELPRSVLLVLFILALVAGTLMVLSPFLTSIIAATTVAIATWPTLQRVERRLGGRRGLAITLLTIGLAFALLLPLAIGAVATAQNLNRLVVWMRELPNREVPSLPAWVDRIPLLGPRLESGWATFTAGGSEGVRARIAEHANDILRWLMARLGDLLGMLIQVLVTLAITVALYVRGESVSAALLRFARRLGGDSGEEAARLAALATRGVALGVVLTPLIQAILAGIGMAVAGVPHFGILALLVLISCLAQAGPVPPLLIPVIWLFARHEIAPGIGLAVWTLVIHITGPVLRPMLIKRGVDLPFALILSGVIGGVMAFGVVGLVIGPVLLAVGSTLLSRWMQGGGAEAEPAGRA